MISTSLHTTDIIDGIVTASHSMAAVLLILISVLATPSLAENCDPQRYRPGLRNSPGPHKLTAQQLNKLLESLRAKAGFAEMRFDETGFLVLGDRDRITGGSAIARELIMATVDGALAIELESHFRSAQLSFAQIEPETTHVQSRLVGTQIERTGVKIGVRSLRLDFYDFEQLHGDNHVLAAFDLGLVVLHELAHGVLHLHDTGMDEGHPGRTVEYINRIRRELDLPERQSFYSHIYRKVRFEHEPAKLISEFRFFCPSKSKKFYLWWETDRVIRPVIR